MERIIDQLKTALYQMVRLPPASQNSEGFTFAPSDGLYSLSSFMATYFTVTTTGAAQNTNWYYYNTTPYLKQIQVNNGGVQWCNIITPGTQGVSPVQDVYKNNFVRDNQNSLDTLCAYGTYFFNQTQATPARQFASPVNISVLMPYCFKPDQKYFIARQMNMNMLYSNTPEQKLFFGIDVASGQAAAGDVVPGNSVGTIVINQNILFLKKYLNIDVKNVGFKQRCFYAQSQVASTTNATLNDGGHDITAVVCCYDQNPFSHLNFYNTSPTSYISNLTMDDNSYINQANGTSDAIAQIMCQNKQQRQILNQYLYIEAYLKVVTKKIQFATSSTSGNMIIGCSYDITVAA